MKNKIEGKVQYTKVCVFCRKEVTFFHGHKPKKCPYCGMRNYIKPPTETKLFGLQHKYFQTGDTKYISEIFVILKKYAVSIIKKNLPKDFIYHYDSIEEKAEDAATLVIEQYLSHDKGIFYIEHSFGGYLQKKVQQVLFNKKIQAEEKHESLDTTIATENMNDYKDIMDISNTLHVTPIYSTLEKHTTDETINHEDIKNGIMSIINLSMDEIKHIHDNYSDYVLIWYSLVLLLSNHSNDYMDNFYKKFGYHIKEYNNRIMVTIYQFIKEREK